jgi:hypothetical protein
MRYTLANLEKFPQLKQERALGCIPTSIAAIMTYYGAESWNEAGIYDEVDRKKQPGESFCFAVFKKYYLDVHLGKDFGSDTRGFGENLVAWRDFIVDKLRKGTPVIASFSYLDDGPHVMTALQGDTETTSLMLHDPAIGNFRILDVEKAALERMNFRRNNDVLWIERAK